MRATVTVQDHAPAVLFDVDGTLVDSNYLHVHAWQRAFGELDMPVEAWRLHRSIGMDGSRLVANLSGDAADDVQERLTVLHSQYYEQTTSLLRPLPGARELLDRVADLGLQVVLATSAPEDELAILRNVLDRDDLISAVTSSADVDTAKPEPDIVDVALSRAGVSADRAVFVGDAVWDAKASVRAGVRCIGVLSGGVSRGELEEAGASVVFENALDLCVQLDDSPIGELLGLDAQR
jgi:HAD superfamily hydrolase (TIGR01509 family)